MDGSVAGFVPRLLSDPVVELFRADERVFDFMLEGWRAQMLPRGLTTGTIENRCRLVRRFQAFTGEFRWQWRPADVEDFLAERRSREKPISLTTLRSDSNSVAMFCAYLTHTAYGWTEFCERTFDDIPSQICFDWNTPGHHRRRRPGWASCVHEEGASGALRLPRRSCRPRAQRWFQAWLPVYRDSIAFKLCYAFGLRRRELTMLDLHDFGPNPHVPDYGMFGAVTVRWAKGTDVLQRLRPWAAVRGWSGRVRTPSDGAADCLDRAHRQDQ